ncbi:MAG: potassium channel family protein [Acidobacteriota bacterium]|nr:potassium channel family protein [Acidobacteriota bacterium]
MIDSLWTGGGIMLLVLLFADLLLTVFHPQGHGGPLHRRLNRLFWGALRWVGAGLSGPSKDRFLALCGPLIAVFSVGTWGLWLILSFTIIYSPYRGSLLSTTAGDTSWLDVFYFSGYVASTLGIGDIVPASPSLRLLTVVEAMSGFALFAVATTYLLAVYQYVAKEQILALELAGFLEPTAPRLAPAALGDWARPTVRNLLEVVHAHGQYPVLHYFRPVEAERALIIRVGRILDFLDEEISVDPSSCARLLSAVRRYLSELHSGCLPRSHRQDGQRGETAPQSEVDLRNFQAHLLRYLAYPVPATGARKRMSVRDQPSIARPAAESTHKPSAPPRKKEDP